MDALSAVAAAVSLGKASNEGAQVIRKRLAQPKLSKDELGEIREAVQGLEAGLLESQATILDLKASILELREKNLGLAEEKIWRWAQAEITPSADLGDEVSKGPPRLLDHLPGRLVAAVLGRTATLGELIRHTTESLDEFGRRIGAKLRVESTES